MITLESYRNWHQHAGDGPLYEALTPHLAVHTGSRLACKVPLGMHVLRPCGHVAGKGIVACKCSAAEVGCSLRTTAH